MKSGSNLKFEIGHVLFVDIVGYSKLLISEQSELVRKLKGIVQEAEQVRLADAAGKLVQLPTGDGIALVFRTSSEAPVQCALEINQAQKSHPELQLRMGIHSGPINEIADVNERTNIAGAGINIAQRIMDCGDAGHILLSKHVAEDLEHYPQWKPYLHELGECEMKHGQVLSVVNLYTDELGNPAAPKKLARRARGRAGTVSEPPSSRKSIAVLPFENRSSIAETAFFADGVQDQILTNLGKVSDLRVISHTSVRQYQRIAPRNLGEIAHQLGVAYIVEGSVQRARDVLRVTARLVDARTDSQLWAETYDRDVSDLFAIQSEIAEAIAHQLESKLSPRQKAAIEERPTRDMLAFELYLKARQIIDSYVNIEDVRASLLQALQSLDEAIRCDENFLLAYCYAARAHGLLYFFDLDPSPRRALLAEAAVNAALRLKPDSPQAHLSAADFYFRCHRDYSRAQEELAIARPGLPNDTPFFTLSGYINRRQGHWLEAERELETAVQLDPRNPNAYNLLSDTYVLERKFAKAMGSYQRALATGEKTPLLQIRGAIIEFAATGNAQPLRETLAKAPPDMDVGGGETPLRVTLALIDQDYAEAERVLAASPRQNFQDTDFSFYYPKSWYQAIVARAKGDDALARDAFARVHEILQQRLLVKPKDARTLVVLAQADAGLGRKELAIREAQHAVELMPISRDAYDGPLVLEGLCQVYTWTNERDRALGLLRDLISRPGYISYGLLQRRPEWKPLRGDPRFEALTQKVFST